MNSYIPGVFSTSYATPLGPELWEFLNRPESILQMETATKLERPAVEGIEEDLLLEFGRLDQDDRVKQMIGHMVRQIMERLGYVIAVQNVKITNGAPFSRATRYKRPNDMTFHVFRSSGNPRDVVLTADKTGEQLPEAPEGFEWTYWKSIQGEIRVRIGLGIDDFIKAKREISEKGCYKHHIQRLMRSS